jgi:hypothetical protein
MLSNGLTLAINLFSILLMDSIELANMSFPGSPQHLSASSPVSWQWDQARNTYYYWDANNGHFVYQDGRLIDQEGKAIGWTKESGGTDTVALVAKKKAGAVKETQELVKYAKKDHESARALEKAQQRKAEKSDTDVAIVGPYAGTLNTTNPYDANIHYSGPMKLPPRTIALWSADAQGPRVEGISWYVFRDSTLRIQG